MRLVRDRLRLGLLHPLEGPERADREQREVHERNAAAPRYFSRLVAFFSSPVVRLEAGALLLAIGLQHDRKEFPTTTRSPATAAALGTRWYEGVIKWNHGVHADDLRKLALPLDRRTARRAERLVSCARWGGTFELPNPTLARAGEELIAWACP